VVLKAWSIKCEATDPMEVWQSKVRAFRRLVRGWASSVVAELNMHKQVVAAEDVRKVVLKAWSIKCEATDPMEVWQSKVRAFRRLVRGWASSVVAELNRHK
jgi:hypothetical protein